MWESQTPIVCRAQRYIVCRTHSTQIWGTWLAIPHLARLPDSGTEFLHTLWGLYALLDIHYVKKSVAQKKLKKSIEKPETKDKKLPRHV